MVRFEPDLVIIYCDSEQLSLLILAREYKDGHDLPCQLQEEFKDAGRQIEEYKKYKIFLM
jgi:uncharacterized protein (DUF169 family)